ncbi:putative retrovirus polyprotein [Puccinia sorghi]|uniref:Putative retrovirus polyprotein n=1 Tax=Puccinia sorghi TaxID=27349 RepID=A0A0L6UJN2_9BASI|nr:putative retrovirus polyprotein [Puccinia sorghi]
MFEKCLIIFEKTVCVIVSSDGISMDPAKCQKVLDWPQPLSVKTLQEPFEVLTDHNALKYFMSSKVLTRRQARWAEFLSEFHFTITYQPGKLAVVLDALSRRDKVYPREGKAFTNNNPDNF